MIVQSDYLLIEEKNNKINKNYIFNELKNFNVLRIKNIKKLKINP